VHETRRNSLRREKAGAIGEDVRRPDAAVSTDIDAEEPRNDRR
jgi:hypothetical protein